MQATHPPTTTRASVPAHSTGSFTQYFRSHGTRPRPYARCQSPKRSPRDPSPAGQIRQSLPRSRRHRPQSLSRPSPPTRRLASGPNRNVPRRSRRVSMIGRRRRRRRKEGRLRIKLWIKRGQYLHKLHSPWNVRSLTTSVTTHSSSLRSQVAIRGCRTQQVNRNRRQVFQSAAAAG